MFKPTPSLLFHNNGDGTFTEVSAGTDIQRALGKALGVVATDINGDGLMDLFVANDTVQNFLFVNRGKGKWEEIGLAAEVGFSANGTPRSGMGVDAADINGDGKQDLFVANVDQEMFSLYRNDGNEFFSDVARFQRRRAGDPAAERLGAEVLRLRQRRLRRSVPRQRPPRRHDRELLAAGALQGAAGAVPPRRHEAVERERAGRAGLPEDVSRRAASRSATTTTTAGSTSWSATTARRRCCSRTHAGAGNHWLGVKLQGTTCNRDAVGATITWSSGGSGAEPVQVERRQLPLVARHARGARHRAGAEDRLGGDQVAASPAAASSASPTCRSTATSIVEGKGLVSA